MKITRSMDLNAGVRLMQLTLAKNLSLNTAEMIISPLLKKKKEISKEQHYRTVLLLSDILERATDEEEAIRMITEKFPEIADIKNKQSDR